MYVLSEKKGQGGYLPYPGLLEASRTISFANVSTLAGKKNGATPLSEAIICPFCSFATSKTPVTCRLYF